jgi:phenylpropionate dioxygenase-like ring-hydroxylating dioxygenase large terminal subunit
MTAPVHTPWYELPIPYGWFCVGYSDEVAPGDVLPLKYFDSHLVMYRTASGAVNVAEAFCPHLGAHLGH